jgi:hypothetical protein
MAGMGPGRVGSPEDLAAGDRREESAGVSRSWLYTHNPTFAPRSNVSGAFTIGHQRKRGGATVVGIGDARK